MSSIKRHVIRKHAIVSETSRSEQSTSCQQETFYIAPSSECSTKHSTHNYDGTKDIFNFEKSAMIKNILKLLTSILKIIIKTNISQCILVSIFYRFEGLMIDSFNYCSSEYDLSNWFIENKLLFSVQRITRY